MARPSTKGRGVIQDSGSSPQKKRARLGNNSTGENIFEVFTGSLLDTPESCEIIPADADIKKCGECGKDYDSSPISAYSDEYRALCPECDKLRGAEIRKKCPLSNPGIPFRLAFDKGTTVVKGTVLMPPEVFAPVKHAKYSPSTYKYREACIGWAPDRTPSEVGQMLGDRGTAIHKAIEREDTSRLHDAGDIECAKKCIGFIQKAVKEFGIPKHLREVEVTVLDQFGYVDDLIIEGDIAEMTDYKTGWRPVEDAETNPQMQGYVLGVFDKFPEVNAVQVNLLMPRQDEISEAVYSREADYAKIKDRVFKIIEGAKASDRLFESKSWEELMKVLNPSADNCEFCGRKAICPALNSLALTVAKRYDPELLIPEHLHGSNITNPDMMSTAMHIAPVLEKWASGVRKAAIDMRVQNGIEIPGYELCERKGSRKITNAQVAWEVVKEKISPEEFAGCVEASMPELEKVVAAKAPRGEKTAAKLHLEDALRDREALQEGAPVHFLKQTRTIKAIEVK